MPQLSRGVRLGATALILGFVVAGPHGVAAADTADTAGTSTSTGTGSVRPHPVGQAHAQSPNSRHSRPTAHASGGLPAVAARAAAEAGFTIARTESRILTKPVAAIAPARTKIAQTRPVEPTAVFAAELPATAEVSPAAAVAPPAPAVAVSKSIFASVRTAFASLVSDGLHLLNGLPTNPIADFMSGTLLLVRRDLEPATAAVTAANQTFVVSTLADSGAGSLRQAILDANTNPGADQITFSVAGVIRVGRTALPTITDSVVIDGTTAPGYVAAPVVRVDYHNTTGLTLAAGANESAISALSLVDAAGAGITIAASNTTLTGNYIGLWGNGRTVEANRGDGVLIEAGADGNHIGVGGVDTFRLSNVISGNRGNGITISGGNDNVVEANFVGTDPTGTKVRANHGNGIQITAGAADNLIGGIAAAGNNPTNGVFRRPPQGNLVSGNCGNGVLIDGGATGNQLSGNYIGTQASGNAALGNRRDGVAIDGADFNQLIGTTYAQDPFVFYNVISGNNGNGLRITNSDHTIVHADFFGIGADNATAVPNRGDGMLVNGDSQFVDAGGEIPLGNVMSGNRRWGIEVADTVGGFISFNNFVGQAAFLGAVPNRRGGILVTSSNPGFNINDQSTWIRIRTSLIGGNHGNGIEFAGDAHGAEITDTAVGTNYDISGPLPNSGNGIVVRGNSNLIAIGGFQPSVEQAAGDFSIHVGSNRGYGIVFEGNAHDNFVFDSRVGIGSGATVETAVPLPNGRGGIYLGPGTSNITIGGLRQDVTSGPHYSDEIVGNRGDGIVAFFSKDLRLLGSTIAGNKGSGVTLNGTSGSTIGNPLAGNIITGNGLFGIYITGCQAGSTVQSDTIRNNGAAGIRLGSARGITVGGTTPDQPNEVSGNAGWGIFASGWSKGSTLSVNFVFNNTRGDVSTWAAIGLVTV